MTGTGQNTDVAGPGPFELPDSIRDRLLAVRSGARRLKLTKALLLAAFAVLASMLVVFGLDRFVDTPRWLRSLMAMSAWCCCVTCLPWVWFRWIRGTRRLDQVAQLVRRRLPALGDQLLGVVELVSDEPDPGTSRTLAAAAIRQVEERIGSFDPAQALPKTRHRAWAIAAGIPAAILCLITIWSPDAGRNALQRWLRPWSSVPRFTLTQLESLPAELVVAHGEPFRLQTRLAESSHWRPAAATAEFDLQQPVRASFADGTCEFELPARTESGVLHISAGDYTARVAVRVELRPELTAISAAVTLPEYLQRDDDLTLDARGGTVSVVEGATVGVDAEISRPLSQATVNERAATINDVHLSVPPFTADASATLSLAWQDELGLTSAEPYVLRFNVLPDAEPAIMLRPEDSEPVILTTEVVGFEIQARDDFGVRAVGLEWHGQIDSESDLSVESRSKLVRPGDPESAALNARATFCADTDEVRPQTLELRAWAEDYLPDRPRVYSPSLVLHVLTPDEHAAWLTGQLKRWASASEDVYEEEIRLHDENRRLQQLTSDALNSPETRVRLDQQAAAERTNAKRLTTVISQGEDLIRRATRNPAMEAGHLQVWAGSLQQLRDISDNRMPAVAELLSAGARSAVNTPHAAPGDGVEAPVAGTDRSNAPSDADSGNQSAPPATTPSVTDIESGFNPATPDRTTGEGEEGNAGSGRLGLPSTTLTGGPQSGSPGASTSETVSEAVEVQARLLADFQRVRDDLQRILEDLDNSTFVKRLKSASRQQLEMAADLNRTLVSGFGLQPAALQQSDAQQIAHLENRAELLVSRVADIQSDLRAWCDRTELERFHRIFEEMNESAIVDQLSEEARQIHENRSGDAISRAEFWADTLDRWAEELVVPSQTSTGEQEGGTKDSLPPELVLEIMRILKSEIDLREETRSAEQARPGLEFSAWRSQAMTLSSSQEVIRQRINTVVTSLLALPEGSANFGDEANVLELAGEAMHEAAQLLAQPGTGAAVIAAETEAIELLLRSNRANPSAQGSGGAAPGGGGTGSTSTEALTLYGPAGDRNAVIEERGVTHAAGSAADGIPDEYRAGLDAWFNAIEQ